MAAGRGGARGCELEGDRRGGTVFHLSGRVIVDGKIIVYEINSYVF